MRLALQQHGVITLDQALELGCSAPAFKRLVAAGDFERILPGVYRLTAAPQTPRQSLKAACLWGGEGTAASHTSAGACLRLKGCELGEIHVVTIKNPQRLPSWVHAHRLCSPIPGLRVVDGIPVTPPWVTLIDVASILPQGQVARALDDALWRGMVSLPQMRWALGEFGRPNQRGTVVMRSLLLRRGRGYEPAQGELEERFFALVDSSDLPGGLRQFQIWDGKKFRYFDLAFPDERVAIELDGWETHGTREAFQDDRRRDRATQLLGWRVLRYTWDDVVNHPDEVVAEIRRALHQKVR